VNRHLTTFLRRLGSRRPRTLIAGVAAAAVLAIGVAATTRSPSASLATSSDAASDAPTTVVAATAPERLQDDSSSVATTDASPASTPGSTDPTATSEPGRSTELTAPDDEGALPVEAGAVSVLVAPAAPGSHPGGTAPSWQEAHLAPFESPAPPDPDPVAVPPYDADGPGGLVSNAYGCLSDCIVHALLIPQTFHTDLGVDVETNVPAASYVWATTTQPAIQGGVPVMTTWPTIYNQHESKEWTSTLTGLAFATTYHIVVMVVDDHGNETWAMTTYTTVDAPGPGQLVGNGDGCYYQCITDAILYPGETFDTVDMVLVASLDVDFDVAVSTSAPGTIAGKPFLPEDEPFAIVQDGGNDVRGRVTGLQPDTVYNVVVRATDGDGFTAHAVGQFRTDPAPAPVPTDVKITWERIHVADDGDPGAWGQGEIGFAWGLGPENAHWRTYGNRYEEKIDDGTSIVLGGPNHAWASVLPGESLPTVVVNARERDSNGVLHLPEPCVNFFPTHLEPVPKYNSSCLDRTNVARYDVPTLETIRQLPPCRIYGLTGDQEEDRCVVIESPTVNENYAQIDVLVSFHIVEP
jgi:hypothetical protein